MALSSAQQNKIVQLLGYPGKTLDAGSVVYDKILADRLLNLNSDAEALAIAYLASIAAIETQIASAPTRFMSEQVGDIRLNKNEMTMLRSERKAQIKELARLLNINALSTGGINITV